MLDVASATSAWNGAKWKPEADASNVVLTPRWLVDRIRTDVLGGVIDLDPATTPDNPVGASRFVCLPDDGIITSWSGNVFVNPPWGRTLPIWVDRVILGSESSRIVLLVPSRTDSRWFQEAVQNCDDMLLFGRRLDYEFPNKPKKVRARGATGALFASALFGFGVSLQPLSDLGTVVVRKTKTCIRCDASLKPNGTAVFGGGAECADGIAHRERMS